MIKISKPAIPAKVHLKYKGCRFNLVQKYSALINTGIEFEQTFKNIRETITVRVKLFDDKTYYLGLISRKMYTEINDELIQFEDGYLIHHTIILENSLTYFSGVIMMDVNVNGEIINEVYSFKVFINGASNISDYVIAAEIDCENFIT